MRSSLAWGPSIEPWPLAARLVIISIATALPWTAIYFSVAGGLGG